MCEEKVYSRKSDKDEIARSHQWTIDAGFGLLKDGNGVEARLEPRLSKLMCVLLKNAEKFVSRHELIDTVWADTVVTEQSLTRAVSDLRKTLRTNFSTPPMIETASKQGYRLSFPPQDQESHEFSFGRFARRVGYGFGALVLIVLVLRGLNY